MIHRGWMRRLRAYHDGSLDIRAARNLEAHLEQCAVCSGMVREMLTADSLLLGARATTPTLAPDDARAMFEIAVARSGIRSRQRGLLGWRLAGLATWAVFCAVGAIWFREARTVETVATPVLTVPARTALHRGRDKTPPVVEGVVTDSVKGLDAAPQGLQRVDCAASPRRRLRRLRQQPTVVRTAAAVVIGEEPRSVRPQPTEAPLQTATLLVLLTEAPPPLVVTVTEAPPETPGFARADSTLITATGEQVITQSTISSCGPEQSESPQSDDEELMQAPPVGPGEESDAD
ncbi:MAG: anti-sigma factor family protein [Actinomycetota bacterium]